MTRLVANSVFGLTKGSPKSVECRTIYEAYRFLYIEFVGRTHDGFQLEFSTVGLRYVRNVNEGRPVRVEFVAWSPAEL